MSENNEQQIQPEDLLDLNEIMQAFGVQVWDNLGPVDTLESARGVHLLVEFGGQRYLLRERPEGMIEEDLSHRYDFEQYLRQAGIPIPAVYLTAQGEPAVLLGDDAFELRQWVDGEQFSTLDAHDLDRVASAGSMLGRIHQASSKYAGHQHRWPSEAHMGAMVQGWLNLAREKAETSEIQAIAAALADWTEQWERVLPSAMVSIGAGGALPEWHIHGDYHAHNLLFNDSNVVAVTGLEASRWEKRLFEVAYALFYFSALAWVPGDSLTRPLVKRGFEPERARLFLQSYSELCPPVGDEPDLLTDALMIVAPIVTINGPLEDLFYTQSDPEQALIRNPLDSSGEIETIEDVMERLSWATSLPAWLERVRPSLAEWWG